jgi:hypothetical protein
MPDFPKRTQDALDAVQAWEAHIDVLQRHADAQPRVTLSTYPQLAGIAVRRRPGTGELTELEARELYQRYWHDLDWRAMDNAERDLFGWLWAKYGDVMSPMDTTTRLPRIDDPPEECGPLTAEEASTMETLAARFEQRLRRLRAQQAGSGNGTTSEGEP